MFWHQANASKLYLKSHFTLYKFNSINSNETSASSGARFPAPQEQPGKQFYSSLILASLLASR